MVFDLVEFTPFITFLIGISFGVLKKEDKISNLVFFTLGIFLAVMGTMKVIPYIFEEYDIKIKGLETLVDALETVKIDG